MRYFSFSLILTTMLAFPIYGMGDEHHDHQSAASTTQQTIPASGQIKMIADNYESIRIFHNPVPELKWPAMNMPFDVESHELIHSLSVGDKVNFEFIQKNGRNIIVRIQKQ